MFNIDYWHSIFPEEDCFKIAIHEKLDYDPSTDTNQVDVIIFIGDNLKTQTEKL